MDGNDDDDDGNDDDDDDDGDDDDNDDEYNTIWISPRSGGSPLSGGRSRLQQINLHTQMRTRHRSHASLQTPLFKCHHNDDSAANDDV